MEALEQIGIVPIDYAALRSLFSSYSSPHNKITNLENEGIIVRLKRGLYVVSPTISKQLLSSELIANHLYGPSYISRESALRYYGMIPEMVYNVQSMTTNRSKKYNNSLGRFEFTTLREDYYPIGIAQQNVDQRYTFLIATPEKALCDMLTTTPRLKLQSINALNQYLERDIRFDMDALKNMDARIVKQCIETGKKKSNLRLLLKLIER